MKIKSLVSIIATITLSFILIEARFEEQLAQSPFLQGSTSVMVGIMGDLLTCVIINKLAHKFKQNSDAVLEHFVGIPIGLMLGIHAFQNRHDPLLWKAYLASLSAGMSVLAADFIIKKEYSFFKPVVAAGTGAFFSYNYPGIAMAVTSGTAMAAFYTILGLCNYQMCGRFHTPFYPLYLIDKIFYRSKPS